MTGLWTNFKLKLKTSFFQGCINSFARSYNCTSFYFDIVLCINNVNGIKPSGCYATYIIYSYFDLLYPFYWWEWLSDNFCPKKSVYCLFSFNPTKQRTCTIFFFFCFFVNLLPSQLNSYFKFSSYHVTCNIFTLSGYNSSNQKTGDVSVELKCNTRTPTAT